MRKSLSLAGLLATTTCLSLGVTQAAETLLDVYQRAVQSDPQIREAEANYLATLESKPQARSAILPQIDFNAQYTDQTSEGGSTFPQFDTNSGAVVNVDSFSDTDSDTTTWDVQLRQTLFRWDQFVTLQQSDKRVSQAGATFESAKQDLLIRVAERYFDVLAARDTLNSETGAREAIGRQLEQAEKRFEVGLIAITDVQEAKAGFDQAVATEIAAKRSLATAQEFLREITGEYIAELAGPRPELPLENPEPADEQAWVETAKSQNLGLIASRIAAEIARDEIRIRRGNHYPTLDLVASTSDRDTNATRTNVSPGATGADVVFTGPADSDSQTDSISVQFSFPIFSGGLTSSRVKEAVYQHRAAKEALERVARETERQTRDAYLGVLSEISRVRALRQAVESSATALKATEAGFEVGTRTTVDVLVARRALLQAETNYARSRYDYILNVLRLKQAAGILNVQDVEEVDSWLEQES